jgi:hypothetical protein
MNKELNHTMASMLVPEEILQHFELVSIEEKGEEFILRLEEKEDRIPKAMHQKKKAVLDGFCNPLELQTFPVKGKQVYLQLYRRRWKENTDGQEHYSNAYDFHEPGMKATRQFGAFLKDALGD